MGRRIVDQRWCRRPGQGGPCVVRDAGSAGRDPGAIRAEGRPARAGWWPGAGTGPPFVTGLVDAHEPDVWPTVGYLALGARDWSQPSAPTSRDPGAACAEASSRTRQARGYREVEVRGVPKSAKGRHPPGESWTGRDGTARLVLTNTSCHACDGLNSAALRAGRGFRVTQPVPPGGAFGRGRRGPSTGDGVRGHDVRAPGGQLRDDHTRMGAASGPA